MSTDVSSWIPRKRIRIAIGIAVGFASAAIVGTLWTRAALVLLAPALGAGWAAFVMLRIRHQLSPSGGGWQSRIHDLVVSRLALPTDARASVLDIGCGDASLLIRLLDHAPAMTATGVDFWGENWDYAQSACEERLAAAGHTATLRRMDAAHLDFSDGCFDVVLSVMCFHEVRASAGTTTIGPLLALTEALRVLRPGGLFVLVDRFESDFGDRAALATVLTTTSVLRRERLDAVLDLPWPLRSKRALGPVEVLSGHKAGPDA